MCRNIKLRKRYLTKLFQFGLSVLLCCTLVYIRKHNSYLFSPSTYFENNSQMIKFNITLVRAYAIEINNSSLHNIRVAISL